MRNPETSRIAWSLIFAFAIIASAFVFKGSAASYEIETALTGAALTFAVLKRPACTRS
jgi:hypothetical protein